MQVRTHWLSGDCPADMWLRPHFVSVTTPANICTCGRVEGTRRRAKVDAPLFINAEKAIVRQRNAVTMSHAGQSRRRFDGTSSSRLERTRLGARASVEYRVSTPSRLT